MVLSRLVTAPATEPVTLAEAKAHLRLEHDLDDTYVTTLIQAARQHAEEVCWRGMISQTWEVVLSAFPSCDSLELPHGALASITSVTYTDTDGDSQTLSTDVYEADTVSVPGRIRLKYGQSWPGSRTQWDAVRIQYVVGWADADSVPAPLKQAILLLVSQMYEHRTPEVDRSLSQVQFAVSALLAPYRLVSLG